MKIPSLMTTADLADGLEQMAQQLADSDSTSVHQYRLMLAAAERMRAHHRLAVAVGAIIPLGSNGLIDELWSLCRQDGQHGAAEEITTKSNAVRAALAALQ